MERRKLFRRRLFSEAQPPRRKLFCDHILVCLDCGHEIHTTGVTTDMVCPNCGSSNRFAVKDEICGELRVAQSEDSHQDATDELLKEFSGKTISQEGLQKLFTERGVSESIDSLVNSGYASLNDEGQVCFSERPDLTRKFFSELVISVTKELHLIPTENKVEELIHCLEERGNISPKGIVLVKKAHRIPDQSEFSETASYIKDSGIANDLKLEYSGKTMPLKDFMDILNTQYNDAPDDLLDKLVETGIVKIMGSQVEIN